MSSQPSLLDLLEPPPVADVELEPGPVLGPPAPPVLGPPKPPGPPCPDCADGELERLYDHHWRCLACRRGHRGRP